MFDKNGFNWKGVAILISFLALFWGLCVYFFGFTLDDAYITFRYSQHLANGYGPVWNIGQDPVEGYSSFLWMLLMAMSIKLGLDPVYFSKLISMGAAVIIICIIYFYGTPRINDQLIPIIAIAGVALSPAFALLTVQGMETIFTALLVLGGVVLSIRLMEKYSNLTSIFLSLLLLLTFLARLDLIVFELVLAIVMMLLLYKQQGKRSLFRFVIILLVFLVIPGLAYMFWRFSYFGYLFPNTFYIKQATHLLSLGGIIMVFQYVTLILTPYILLTFYSLSKQRDLSQNYGLRRGFPATISLVIFLALYFFIFPIQGFLFRFQMVTLPSFLFLFSFFVGPLEAESGAKHQRKQILNLQRWLMVLLSALVIVFPLHMFDDAHDEMAKRTQFDRVIVGKELEALAHRNFTMFVTESGALPYYSKWRAIDHLGLNSEHIAHNGLSIEYLEEISPNLVMLLVESTTKLEQSYPIVYQFLSHNDYVAVAAVRKYRDWVHLYFVKSSNVPELAQHLVGISGLEYTKVDQYVGNKIRIWQNSK
jgi:arabinofuranosyltransferase